MTARIYTLWFGAFLILQAFLTPLLVGDFVTLPPHMRSTVEVRATDLPGVPPGLRQVTTDERGFRVNPRVDYGAKRGLRVFAIGGSSTECILLDDASTWTHLLQDGIARRGTPAEVINTGVSGLRAVHHLATLNIISRLDPDLVIFLFGANDWNRHIASQFERDPWTPVSLRYSALGMMLERRVITPLRQNITGRSWADRTWVIDGPDGFFTGSEYRSIHRSVTHTFRPREVAADYAATLGEISRACKERRVTCLFITQPYAYSKETPADLRARFWMTPPGATYTLDFESMAHIASLYNDHLKSFAAREGHPLCDLASRMRPSLRYFVDDIHFTDEGARHVAEVVLPCVQAALDLRPRSVAERP